MRAVIMAGGKGTRLTSLTNGEIPKPMVRLCGKPILEMQIERLRENGIREITLIVGHLKEIITAYFGNGKKFGVEINYIEENEPLGSGGALYLLKGKITDDFLLVFGDTVFDINVSKMHEFHKEKNAALTLYAHPNSHPFDSDLVIADENGKVERFDSKHNVRDYYYSNLVNAAFFILSPKSLEVLTELKKTDLEKDFISALLASGYGVYAYSMCEYIKDVGTPERIRDCEKDIKNGIIAAKNIKNAQKCVFLDRDGTLNEARGFIKNHRDVQLIDGVCEAVLKLNRSGYLAVIITNQPVIARGEASEEEVRLANKVIETELGKKGAFVDAVYFCPHHPHSGFEGEVKALKIDCDCRKPKIGLLLKARDKFNIDFSRSFFVGDTPRDVETGINAGMKTVKVKSAEGAEPDARATFNCDNLAQAVDYILQNGV